MHPAIARETKLDAGPEFTLPDLRGLVPRTVVRTPQHLWSTYFDSRDLRLYARAVTLRHRQGEDGGPGVWTLSLPAVDERVRMTRTEPTWTGPVDPVPDDALQMLRGILRREPLRVVTELECSRRRVALEDEGGRSLGEVDHDTVTVHGGAHDGLRFHEVEVAQGWLRRQAVAGSGLVGFAAGQLAAGQRRRQLGAPAGRASLGHRLTRAHRHRWMSSSA